MSVEALRWLACRFSFRSRSRCWACWIQFVSASSVELENWQQWVCIASNMTTQEKLCMGRAGCRICRPPRGNGTSVCLALMCHVILLHRAGCNCDPLCFLRMRQLTGRNFDVSIPACMLACQIFTSVFPFSSCALFCAGHCPSRCCPVWKLGTIVPCMPVLNDVPRPMHRPMRILYGGTCSHQLCCHLSCLPGSWPVSYATRTGPGSQHAHWELRFNLQSGQYGWWLL